MMLDHDPLEEQHLKDWWLSKRVMRATEYRRRMEQTHEADPQAWLKAVALDDEREELVLVIEEQPA